MKSRYTELVAGVFGAFLILAFWGTNAEGQTPLLGSLVRQYVTETAVALNLPSRVSGLQLAEMNSLFAGTGGDSSSLSPAPTLEATTIKESAMIALAPSDVDYMDQLTGHRSQVIEYEVQEGDLLSFIASDFGVSTNSIIWANSLKDADSISPGQILRIPPITGVIHRSKKGDTVASLAKKYAADEERIIAYNSLAKDGSIDEGEDIIIPDGRMTYVAPAAATGTASVARLAQSAKQFAHLPDLGGYFGWPTSPSGFNWGRVHGRNGVDVANSCGTPVYASADGVVTVADGDGYNGGFGKYIKISHPNGTETLYAHSMKLLVSPGQAVGKGQTIMLMGTTGRSTGCHVHFEVHGAKNPLAKL